MSQENVETVRRSFEAFAHGDFDTAFAAYDASTEWRTAADEPDQQTYRGIASLRAFVGSLTDTWEDRFGGLMEFEAFIDRGDWVVVPWSAELRGKGSGLSVHVDETYAVRVQGGKIVRVEEPEQGAGPRSRGAAGVGDVAGKQSVELALRMVAVAQSRLGKAAARSLRWPPEHLGVTTSGRMHLA